MTDTIMPLTQARLNADADTGVAAIERYLSAAATAAKQDTANASLAAIAGFDVQTGFTRLTGATEAQTYTVPADSTDLLIGAEGGEIRVTLPTTPTGTAAAATSTSGMRIPADGTLPLRVAPGATISIYLPNGSYANLWALKRA